VVVWADNVPSTWPVVWTILNQLPHIIYVLTGDSLRYGESEGNLNRNTKLVESEYGIGSDD
jgi:hypothetical protein